MESVSFSGYSAKGELSTLISVIPQASTSAMAGTSGVPLMLHSGVIVSPRPLKVCTPGSSRALHAC